MSWRCGQYPDFPVSPLVGVYFEVHAQHFSLSMRAKLPNEVEVTVYFSPHRSGRWKAVSFNTLSAVFAWKTRLGEWWPTLAKQMYPANSGSCCKQRDGSTEISLFLCAWDFGNKEEWFCFSDTKCFHCAHQQATISAEHLVFLSFQRRSCGWEKNEELLKSAISCFKFSFAADVHAQQHPETGEHLASNIWSDQNCLAALPLSSPFSVFRVHDPQSNSLNNACTNIVHNIFVFPGISL